MFLTPSVHLSQFLTSTWDRSHAQIISVISSFRIYRGLSLFRRSIYSVAMPVVISYLSFMESVRSTSTLFHSHTIVYCSSITLFYNCLIPNYFTSVFLTLFPQVLFFPVNTVLFVFFFIFSDTSRYVTRQFLTE
jgi:hypothetical protein